MAPAVHINRLAGDELARGEEDGGGGDVLGSAAALERNRLRQTIDVFLVLPGRRKDQPGRDAVDRDPRRQLERGRSRDGAQNVLAQDVGGMCVIEA